MTADSPGTVVPEVIQDFSEEAAAELSAQYAREQLPEYKEAIKRAVIQETINCLDRHRFDILARAKLRAEELLGRVKLS